MKIIKDDEEGSFDALIKKARKDRTLREIIHGEAPDFANTLIYAVDHNIFMHLDKGEDKKIVKRSGNVSGLAYWDGKICDCGSYYAICNPHNPDDVVSVTTPVNAIASYHGDLYYCSASFPNIKSVNRKEEHKFPEIQTAIALHQGNLLAGDTCGNIHYMSGQSFCRNLGERIGVIFNRGSDLYCGSGKKIFKISDKVKEIGKRDYDVRAMCAYKGKLIDGGEYGVFDTLSNEPLYPDLQVAAMINVPNLINMLSAQAVEIFDGLEDLAWKGK
jgi:hypothetical protein